MNIRKNVIAKFVTASGIALLVLSSSNSGAAPLNIVNEPLFLNAAVPPLNMLVLGRDHKLFMAAYNDASDLTGDGVLDVGYRGYLPNGTGGFKIDYFGYFDSFKCYTYAGGVFSPSSKTTDKKCGGSAWSGDFLNYVTTSRIDALRKVLYGGYRNSDPATGAVILERAYIPQDAHSWGKEYRSVAADGYNIADYTAGLTAPTAGKYILFANTTLATSIGGTTNPGGAPLMRVMANSTHRVWEWLSKEAPVAGGECATPGSWTSAACDITPVDYTVRVEVCKSGTVPSLLEANCKQYPNGSYKPTGLLHDYGENDLMYFGLLTGSYVNNYQGGVLRKEVTSFTDEIIANSGQFVFPTKKGLIGSLDGFKIEDFNGGSTYSHNRNCSNPWDNPQPNGNCRIWGNPVGEMAYESLRYFAGATSGIYSYINAGSDDAALGLTQVTTAWKNPYAATASGGQGYPLCSKPFDTIVSDVNTSFDSELPGNPWTATAASTLSPLATLDVNTMGQQIWNNEFGAGARNIFIGEVGATANGAPSAKTATSFGNIRGLSPEEPTRQGTYYTASIAAFGFTNDISGAANPNNRPQKLNTFAVALSSPLPRMEIPVGGRKITLIPFGKVIKGPSGITASWQPTEQIVAFYIDTMENMPGQTVNAAVNGGRPYIKFRINFEDAEQGSDYDMDEIVLYEMTVTAANTLTVRLTTEYASAGHESHIGYVISGTDNFPSVKSSDGIYLETQGGGSQNNHYAFDTPAGKWAGECVAAPALCALLPTVGNSSAARTFTPGANPPATLLKDPLWYAAKYGGYDDKNNNNLPDAGEWDSKVTGTPDNYFLVTNALTLGDQLAKAFKEILGRTASAASASVNSGSISSNTRLYQSKFTSINWTGNLLSYSIDPVTGNLSSSALWDASWTSKLPLAASRQIITRNSNGASVPFKWTDLDGTRQAQLNNDSTLLDYLRGDPAKEGTTVSKFRLRVGPDGAQNKLGDIISSSPAYVGAPIGRYADALEGTTNLYSTFRSNKLNRIPMVYVGANDGMLHGFNANTGVEQFSYIPASVFGNLKNLASQSYSHQYFVDGSPTVSDAFYGGSWKTVLVGGLNKGGQSIYALDITNPITLGNAEANASSIALWEYTDADLGYTYSKPQIVRLNNGKWAAVFGNGYNNTINAGATGEAALYVVDISNGSLITKLSTKTGSTATPNGLATASAVDVDGDSKVDYVYAGDLLGNLWKFDLRDTNDSNWKVSYGTTSVPLPLYAARDAAGTPNLQPVTSRPRVILGPNGDGLTVLFGTGKFLELADKNTPTPRVQTFYGIWDKNTGADSDRVSGRTALTQQTILSEGTVDPPAYDPDGAGGPLPSYDPPPVNFRLTSAIPFSSAKSGWYIDLVSSTSGYQNEKQVSDAVIRGDRVIFTTTIPVSDPCSFGGTSWIMELNATSGSRLDESPFDVNDDGVFNSSDRVPYSYTDVTGNHTVYVPVSAVQSTEGILTTPAIVDASTSSKSREFKYNTGTSSGTQKTAEDPRSMMGRQTWRQVR
jgi:type IV pilus assembly protein PilY1